MSEKKEDFTSESLNIPSRLFEETSSLLAYAVPSRRPPSRLKTRVMAALKPEPPAPALARWATAAALTVLLLCPLLLRPALPLSLLSSKGTVTISGGAVQVSPEAEALLGIGGRAVLKLSHGARAVIRRRGRLIEVQLKEGWALSAVRPGTSYRVATDFGSAEALGTTFIVKAENTRAYVCICRGKLLLSGPFPSGEISAAHHYDVFLAPPQPPVPAGATGSMEGHSDVETDSLNRLLSF